jgi:hypothetical protein
VSETVLYLEWPVEQEWRTIELLRGSTLEKVAAAYGDREGAQRLAMVVSELLENAVKFGRWSSRDSLAGLATLRVVAEGRTVTVTVTNPVDPDRPGVEELLERLRGIDESSPEEAYLSRLRTLLAEPDLGAGGLGLVRMAYEAGCRISAQVTAGGVLHVRAVMRL